MRDDGDALSDAYVGFPDLCGFLLYRFLERADVVQQGAVRLHVHRTVRADRVDVHQELLEQGEDKEWGWGTYSKIRARIPSIVKTNRSRFPFTLLFFFQYFKAQNDN